MAAPGGEVAVARRARVLGLAVGLAIGASAVAGYLLLVPGAGRHAAAAPRATRSIAASAAPASRATFAGPDGIEARWVAEENRRPGTTAWKIHDSRGSIHGFASEVYVRSGQTVTLYVSTAATTFRAETFRMGYYQGEGARLVWQSAELAGAAQRPCPVTATINMVSCDNWSPSVTFTVTSAFVQGEYLIKLVGSGNQQSYVPLTVWDPASTATYVIKNDVFTWQAWNPYGGYDFYAGVGSCPATVYPLCSRARVVSFDRPYAAEQGSGNFLSLEYPLSFLRRGTQARRHLRDRPHHRGTSGLSGAAPGPALTRPRRVLVAERAAGGGGGTRRRREHSVLRGKPHPAPRQDAGLAAGARSPGG